MTKSNKLADREEYRGYTIILKSFDWDADYKVYENGRLVHACQDRSMARAWVDARLTK